MRGVRLARLKRLGPLAKRFSRAKAKLKGLKNLPRALRERAMLRKLRKGKD